jgi:hypothetical protein
VASGSSAAAEEPRWISLERAASLRGVTRETMARHAEKHGLGTCTDRRWRIDENRVRALNEGRPYARLDPFPTSPNSTSTGADLHDVRDE